MMDFDLSSAKPVESEGFDLSSASVGNQQQSSAYVPMSAASSLPPTWSPTVQGQKVRTSYDPQAKGYLTTGANGAELMVVRHPDGGLMLTKYTRPKIDPTEDMSAFKTGAAGAGKVLSDTGRGIVQLGTLAGNTLGLVSDEAVDKSFEREREVSEQDQALMDTTAGKVGYGVGLIGTAVTPGVVLKGAGLAAKGAGLAATGAALDTAGTAVLAPQTYKGAMALGATQGALLPSESYEGKVLNVGIGAGAGAAGQLVGNTISKGINKAQLAKELQAEALAQANNQALPQILNPQLKLLLKQNGIDVGTMSREAQRGLRNYIENTPNAASPEAMIRVARAQSLQHPVTLTKGGASGDFPDQQAESILNMSPTEGAAIRAHNAEINKALTENLKSVSTNQRPTATDPYHTGKAFQQALGKAEDASLTKVGQLYDKAELTGGNQPVDPQPMIDGLMKHLDDLVVDNDAKPALSMLNVLKRMGLATVDSSGNILPTGKTLTATEAMALYKSANQKYVQGSNSSRILGDLKRGILEALDNTGTTAGSDFKAATASFKAHAEKFDNPKLVSALLRVTKGTDDPIVASENVLDKIVMKGSIDDIKNIKATLASSDKTVRKEALQAWRNMRAATADFLLEKAYMGNSVNVAQERVISGSNILNAVKQIGGGGSAKNEALGWMKIEAIMGKKPTQELKNIVQVTLDATRKVNGAATTSGTAERLAAIFSHVPLAKPATILVKAGLSGVKTQANKMAEQEMIKAVPKLMQKKATALGGSALTGAAVGQTGRTALGGSNQ
jgi:hypothetical protein